MYHVKSVQWRMTCPSKTTIERICFNTTKDACQDVQKIKTRNISNGNVGSSAEQPEEKRLPLSSSRLEDQQHMIRK